MGAGLRFTGIQSLSLHLEAPVLAGALHSACSRPGGVQLHWRAAMVMGIFLSTVLCSTRVGARRDENRTIILRVGCEEESTEPNDR